MENDINKIITLNDKDEYLIIDQGNYNNKAYYLLVKLDVNENLTSNISIVENNNGHVESVKDSKLLESLIKYFDERSNK